ncbi:MAG: hypothetical protein TECD_00654 [Hyphomicrobiaceae bacterium hypho_1]
MCIILKFAALQMPEQTTRDHERNDKTADIILFPGVRYETAIDSEKKDIEQMLSLKRDIIIL